VLHTGWCAIPAGRTLAHDHPLQVEDVLADFPALRIVLAHCGFAWSEQVLFALAAHPSLYADLAYWSPTMPGWRAAQTLSHAKYLGVVDRLLWGTDYPFAEPAGDLAYWRGIPQVSQRLGLEPGVADADIDALTGDNAARLYAAALGAAVP
jgi:predicted TIM-barrel fold metal-dependent hydrolase